MKFKFLLIGLTTLNLSTTSHSADSRQRSSTVSTFVSSLTEEETELLTSFDVAEFGAAKWKGNIQGCLAEIEKKKLECLTKEQEYLSKKLKRQSYIQSNQVDCNRISAVREKICRQINVGIAQVNQLPQRQNEQPSAIHHDRGASENSRVSNDPRYQGVSLTEEDNGYLANIDSAEYSFPHVKSYSECKAKIMRLTGSLGKQDAQSVHTTNHERVIKTAKALEKLCKINFKNDEVELPAGLRSPEKEAQLPSNSHTIMPSVVSAQPKESYGGNVLGGAAAPSHEQTRQSEYFQSPDLFDLDDIPPPPEEEGIADDDIPPPPPENE